MRFPTMWNVRPAQAQTSQSDQSLCLSLEHSFTVKLLTEYHLTFLSLRGGCTGSSWSTHVKMPHCWKSHAMAQLYTDDVTVLDAGTYLHADHSPVLCTCINNVLKDISTLSC